MEALRRSRETVNVNVHIGLLTAVTNVLSHSLEIEDEEHLKQVLKTITKSLSQSYRRIKQKDLPAEEKRLILQKIDTAIDLARAKVRLGPPFDLTYKRIENIISACEDAIVLLSSINSG